MVWCGLGDCFSWFIIVSRDGIGDRQIRKRNKSVIWAHYWLITAKVSLLIKGSMSLITICKK